jgi:hypothetical protein
MDITDITIYNNDSLEDLKTGIVEALQDIKVVA